MSRQIIRQRTATGERIHFAPRSARELARAAQRPPVFGPNAPLTYHAILAPAQYAEDPKWPCPGRLWHVNGKLFNSKPTREQWADEEDEVTE